MFSTHVEEDEGAGSKRPQIYFERVASFVQILKSILNFTSSTDQFLKSILNFTFVKFSTWT